MEGEIEGTAERKSNMYNRERLYVAK